MKSFKQFITEISKGRIRQYLRDLNSKTPGHPYGTDEERALWHNKMYGKGKYSRRNYMQIAGSKLRKKGKGGGAAKIKATDE